MSNIGTWAYSSHRHYVYAADDGEVLAEVTGALGSGDLWHVGSKTYAGLEKAKGAAEKALAAAIAQQRGSGKETKE